MNTVFKINGENVEVEGVGQATCSAALRQFKNSVVVIKGFLNKTTNKFIPVKLK